MLADRTKKSEIKSMTKTARIQKHIPFARFKAGDLSLDDNSFEN